MVGARRVRTETFKRVMFFLLALMFLSANMATDRHVVHTDLAKFISVNHQVRRDLSRAERENLKTSVASGRGEVVAHPPQQAAAITGFHEIVVNFHPVRHSPTQLQPKSISLDCSPVLNL